MAKTKKSKRRKTSRILLVAIPGHRANTDLVALFRNLTNSLAKKLKKPHLASKNAGATVCPLCGVTPPSGELEAIHRFGHEQIDVVQKSILKERAPVTFDGIPAYMVKLEHMKEFYKRYHKMRKCVTIGCGDCHKKYDGVCNGTIAKSTGLPWWNKLDRSWTNV